MSLVISTVGTGSRLGNITKNLNKGLIPYKLQPTISHILSRFPKGLNVIILVGYQAEQVIDYCNLVHSDRNITFVSVNDWESDKSGTGVSLREARPFITGPFWYSTCDTYFDEDVFDWQDKENTYFVKSVSDDLTHHYCMLETKDNVVTDIAIKEPVTGDWQAFVGLMYINKWQQYFDDLEGVLELVDLIKPGDQTKELNTWLDFGNLQCYLSEVAKTQKYDFSKNDEITYFDNGKVIKWWLDSTVAEKKALRVKQNPAVFPNNVKQTRNWICYDYVEGETLYQHNDPNIMPSFFNWLGEDVWKKHFDKDFYNHCLEFYKAKTIKRVDAFLKKYPALPKVSMINNVPVKDYMYYLRKIDWELLLGNSENYFIHGDLNFDNIIVGSDSRFCLIDWRHEFAGSVSAGDIYYDLAKMLGGCLMNYSRIKMHNFKVELNDEHMTLHVPAIDSVSEYKQHIKEATERLGLSFKKVEALVPLIYWNMSPLHVEPFDILLWYYAILLFEENDQKVY